MLKVALITAGGSGMGADSARALAKDGYKIGILSSSGKAEILAKELGVYGIRVNCVAPGVTNTSMLKKMDEKAILHQQKLSSRKLLIDLQKHNYCSAKHNV